MDETQIGELKAKLSSLWGAMKMNLPKLRSNMPTWPLGKVIEEVYPPLEKDELEKESFPIIRALTNWHRLQLFTRMFQDAFFSREQRSSYCLLFHWLTATLQHPTVVLANIKLMIQGSPTLLQQHMDKNYLGDHFVMWGCLNMHIGMLQQDGIDYDIDVPEPDLTNAYNIAMFQLFMAEFAYPNSEADEHGFHIVTAGLTGKFKDHNWKNEPLDITLKSIRRNAVIQSYCRQASIECLKNIIPDLLAPPLKLNSCEVEIYTIEASLPKFARGLDRGPLVLACPWLPIPDRYKYANSEDEDDEIHEMDSDVQKEQEKSKRGGWKKKNRRRERRGDIERGNGRDESDEDENEENRQIEREQQSKIDRLGGWPEYLWDLRSSRTVRTRSLGYPRPSYTTISHTWGRTVISGPGYKIPGGLSYPIPRNNDFDVEALPDDLKLLQGRISSSFIWLDLLCIPQGDEGDMSEEDRKLKHREIGRQRQIFENAESSIAWLHDIHDLSCLADVFQWLCVSIFETRYGTEDAYDQHQLKKQISERIKDRQTGLVKRWKAGDNDELAIPDEQDEHEGFTVGSSWFNSLWTFQELCLRPDTHLATSGLDIMSFETGEPIPLSGLVCVYNQFASLGKLEEEYPPAVQDISVWHKCTRLGQLLDLTRIDIIEIGSSRYCKERKAEAIMSAIGATRVTEALAEKEVNGWRSKRTDYGPMFIEEIKDLESKEPTLTLSAGPGLDDEKRYGAQVDMIFDGDNHIAAYSHGQFQAREVLDSFFLQSDIY